MPAYSPIRQAATETVTGFAPMQVLRAGSGPPLAWLHGEEGQRGWLPHHARLAERYSVWAPTLPGIGESALPEWVQGVRDMAKVLLAALDAAGITRCILGGASMGGWIAAEMASMQPGRFSGLILAGPQGTATGHLDTPDIFLMPYRRYLSFGYADPESAAFAEMWGGELDDEAVTTDLEVMELAALLGFKPYMHDRSLLPALARYANPALLVWGERDVITPPPVAELFMQALPAAERATIAGAGHYAHLEKPAAFADAVTGFGARLEAD